MLTQERLKELVEYNQETGVFKWKVDSVGSQKKGDIAGYKSNSDGYIRIGIKGKRYLAHRLVILYVDGYIPEGQVDHKDRVKHHNWYSNLRPDVTQQCNTINSNNPSHNTSGIKGVGWSKSKDKWRSSLNVNKKFYHLGYFVCKTEAVAHRLMAEQCLGWGGCDSNSSANQYMKDHICTVR